MNTQQMFVITKSGLTIRPERLKALSDYPKRYIREAHEMVDTYLREGGREHDPVILAMRYAVAQAQEALRELEQLATEVQRIYDRNFEAWAEAFRQARIERGLTRIEDSPELYALLKIVMAMLKAENPLFSEEKFINHINN